MKRWVGLVAVWALSCGVCFGEGESSVPLPYTNAPAASVDWTTLDGWSGTATGVYANGAARFDATGQFLVLHLDGAPTELTFTLTGHTASQPGTAPANFTVEESISGVSDWNSPMAEISEADLSENPTEFGPYMLDNVTRYLRFTCANFYQYNLALSNVRVEGGPGDIAVEFPGREEGFYVAQGAVGETITAVVRNGGGYWFGSEGLEVDPWESDNGGSWKMEDPYDVYTIQTASTGSFYAVANGRADNTDDVVQGTIHFTVSPGHTLTMTAAGSGTVAARVGGQVVATEGVVPEGATVQLALRPAEGFGVESIVLDGERLAGDSFVMPAADAEVVVTFTRDLEGAKTLFISQYYEGSGSSKWVELFNPTTNTIDLASGGYRLGLWQNAAKREAWKTNAAPNMVIALTGEIGAGETYLVAHANATAPSNTSAQQTSTQLGFNGDDSVVLYQGTVYSFANVVDAVGLTGNSAADISLVRTNTVTFGVATDLVEAEWIRVPYATVDAAEGEVPERLGWHAVAAVIPEPEVLTVAVAPSEPFRLWSGEGTNVVATVTHATGEVTFVWTCEPDCGGAAGVDDAAVYAIPADASAGSYVLTCAASDGVTNASAMVSFLVEEPPPPADYTVDFETAWEGASSYAASSATWETNGVSVTWAFTNILRGTDVPGDVKNGVASGRFRHAAVMESVAFPRAITALEVSAAPYGSDRDVGLALFAAAADGEWTQVGSGTPTGTELEVITADAALFPINAVRVRLETFGPESKRVNVDDVRVWLAAEEPPPPLVEPPVLTNLVLEAGSMVFELPAAVSSYSILGAAGLSDDAPFSWAASNITDGCTEEVSDAVRRITVPLTNWERQIIWISIPAGE